MIIALACARTHTHTQTELRIGSRLFDPCLLVYTEQRAARMTVAAVAAMARQQVELEEEEVVARRWASPRRPGRGVSMRSGCSSVSLPAWSHSSSSSSSSSSNSCCC
jgi:hypothetical protein